MTPEVWTIEESLWTGGRGAYEGAVSPDAVFAFPAPTGIMAGNGFVAHLPDSPGWSEVRMEQRTEGAPAADLRVIAYAATGQRSGGEGAYKCTCSSTYRRDGTRWILVQHAQVPGAG